MEDKFVKDFDFSFDNQLLVDYENEIRNEINSLLDDVKKENYLFRQIVNRREAIFWKDIINEFRHCSLLHSKENYNRLIEIIYKYKSLCDMCEKISDISHYIESIKSDKKSL